MIRLYSETKKEESEMNKRIYTFTLDDDDYPSEYLTNNIRIIAILLYEELKVQDYESDNPILIQSKTIQENYLVLVDNYLYSRYKFGSEDSKQDYQMFEPLMFDGRTFGITVNDGTINEEQLMVLLNKVRKLIKFDFDFKIDSIVYTSKNKDDESNRNKAIKEIGEKLAPSKIDKPLVRKLIPTIFSTKVVRG